MKRRYDDEQSMYGENDRYYSRDRVRDRDNEYEYRGHKRMYGSPRPAYGEYNRNERYSEPEERYSRPPYGGNAERRYRDETPEPEREYGQADYMSRH